MYNKSFNKKKKKNDKNAKIITYYKHYLEIEDNEGKPIRVNEKFRENHKNMDIPKKQVDEIRSTIFSKAKTKQRNKKLYNQFHNKK